MPVGHHSPLNLHNTITVVIAIVTTFCYFFSFFGKPFIIPLLIVLGGFITNPQP